MKKFFSIIFFTFFFFSSLIYANCKFAVLDFDKVFKNSLRYQKIINFINFNLYKKYLLLNLEINNLIKQKNNNKYLLKINRIKKNIYFKNKEDYIYKKIIKLEKYINEKNISIHNFFILKIKKIVNSFIKNNKYNAIFDSNVLFYNNKNIPNITNLVVNKLD